MRVKSADYEASNLTSYWASHKDLVRILFNILQVEAKTVKPTSEGILRGEG
jgi:hypothetical protein